MPESLPRGAKLLSVHTYQAGEADEGADRKARAKPKPGRMQSGTESEPVPRDVDDKRRQRRSNREDHEPLKKVFQHVEQGLHTPIMRPTIIGMCAFRQARLTPHCVDADLAVLPGAQARERRVSTTSCTQGLLCSSFGATAVGAQLVLSYA